MLLAPFGSVLDLSWQPNPTALGPATKSDPIAFGKVGNTPPAAILDKKHNKETPPSTVFITQIILFFILILLIIIIKIYL